MDIRENFLQELITELKKRESRRKATLIQNVLASKRPKNLKFFN
jgi:hypothetical protein